MILRDNQAIENIQQMNRNKITKYFFLSILSATLSIQPSWSQETKLFINPNNQHRYLLTPVMSWSEAQSFAQDMGGNLVTINDSQENQWLVETFTTVETKFIWIGINDKHHEGTFCWVGGNSDYTNWAEGEPNDNPQQGGEDFGALNGQANPFNRPIGTWSDAPQQAKLRGIVEIP